MRSGLVYVCALGLVLGAEAAAQQHADTFWYHAQGPGMPGPDTKMFIAAEMVGAAAPVKGAPYSAQAVTEFTQTLADGTHIQRNTTSAVYRDGEGRTRRDQTLGGVGAFGPAVDTALVFISDCVAGVQYVLNAKEQTAQKMPAPPTGTIKHLTAPAGGGGGMDIGMAGAGGVVMRAEFSAGAAPGDMKRDSLGTKQIEGITADGTRMTMTIPAGRIGNDRPISMVTESWYSKQLQTTVMTKTSDPRMGDSTYRLTNINQAEPDPALFQVPTGYTVLDAPKPMTLQAPAPASK
jgi:hypothetical protein